jgi:hypothetical protein
LACPYYQEPVADDSIGCCNNDRGEIPSETHQNCLCRSAGTYNCFCPVYARFQREQLRADKVGFLKRILLALTP